MKIFVETERLILREILLSDVDGIFELDSDPQVHKYLGNKTVSNKSESEAVINYIRQQYLDNGIGRWAIIEKSTNNFVGWTGLKFVTELTNGRKNYYDLGYRLIRKYWGQGIATETAFASLDYGFTKLKVGKVYAAASYENAASNKILQKIGMQFIETFYYEDIKCNEYKIDTNIYSKILQNRESMFKA